MGIDTKLTAAATPEEQRDNGAKNYEKPAIVYREPIEAKAAVCSKAGAPGCSTTPPQTLVS